MNVLIFSLILPLTFARTLTQDKISTKFSTNENLDDYLTQHPNQDILPLIRSDNRFGTLFTLGARTYGDSLAAIVQENQKWSSLQNVLLTLQYPKSDKNLVITYVEIIVNQSSKFNQAFIVEGGIGANNVTIVLEAGSTNRLLFTAGIYAKTNPK